MTSNRFFVPRSSLSEALRELGGQEHYHLSRLVRAKPEETVLRDGGCEAVSLGDRILRAETAALVAAASVILLWNP